jgi:hypothetical protein
MDMEGQPIKTLNAELHVTAQKKSETVPLECDDDRKTKVKDGSMVKFRLYPSSNGGSDGVVLFLCDRDIAIVSK